MMGKFEGYSSIEECREKCPHDCGNPVFRSAAFQYFHEDECRLFCGSEYCPSYWELPLRGEDWGNLIGG